MWGSQSTVFFYLPGNATCLLHRYILFLIKCLLQNLSPCAKAWFTDTLTPTPFPAAALAVITISIFFLKHPHLFVTGFWPSGGSAAAVVWSRDLLLCSRSPESVSPARPAAHLPNGGGAPASSHPVPGGPVVCGDTVLSAPPPARGVGSGNSGGRPQPQAPPCGTQSPKHQGSAGCGVGHRPLRGGGIQGPLVRLAKRSLAWRRKKRRGPQSQGPQAGRGLSLEGRLI